MAIALNTTRFAARTSSLADNHSAAIVPPAAVWDVPAGHRTPRRTGAYGGSVRTLDIERRSGHGPASVRPRTARVDVSNTEERESLRGGAVLGAVFGAALFFTIVFGGGAAEETMTGADMAPQAEVAAVNGAR